MKWNWLWGGGMWAPIDHERKQEFHTLWQDIRLALRYVIGAAFWWLLVWPFAAAVLWWEGRLDAAFEGLFVVGYVWAFAFALVALPLAWLVHALQPVPIWAWLIIIPLLGIWRHVAAMNKRAGAQRDAPPR